MRFLGIQAQQLHLLNDNDRPTPVQLFVVVHSLRLFKLHFAYYEQVLFRIEKIMNPRNRKTAKLSRHKGYSETNANVFIHISVTLWRVLSVANNNTSFLVGMCFSCRSPPKAHVHTVFLSHHPTTQLPKQSYILSGSLLGSRSPDICTTRNK